MTATEGRADGSQIRIRKANPRSYTYWKLQDRRGRKPMEVTRCDVATVAVTAFICANCARPGRTPDSASRPGPTVPEFDWPFPVREVLVPCTGRLQPEHVLKAFESGADLVLTISCDKDNCQYLQGSERWARRADYVQNILDEVGLGGERLMLFCLPGTAAEDMALGAGRPAPVCGGENTEVLISAIREAALQALDGLAPNPLCIELADETAEELYQQVDTSDEANED
jgi:F420-non-reducing hydrogenase iron-sulfur subunit